MFQVPLTTSGSVSSREGFWRSILIYHSRPHIVNRKIAVADQISLHEVNFNDKNTRNITDFLTTHGLSYEVQQLKQIDQESLSKNFLLNMLNVYINDIELSEKSIETLSTSSSGIYLSLRIIVPRLKQCSKSIELVVLDMNKDMVTFYSTYLDKDKFNPLPPFPYCLELTREYLMRITLKEFEDADTPCAEWLCDSLFKKLINWSTLSVENNIVRSLMKIPLQKYCQYYNDLKEKYAEPLGKVWCEKTKTDPQKFIYEDLAIASYLICLWVEEYRSEATNFVEFVDCGCGNGLLVHILNGEGFRGHGIDIRRRSVWDLFSDTADLRVGTVSPDSRFPNATWLIGNHSDELTPWLPVIASKSSSSTNYFVLPCCPFDFNGRKYIRKNTSISQYADYMEYIKQISEMCEFETSIDKLRIPSTKRTCLIGLRKKNNSKCISDLSVRIDNFLKSKFDSNSCDFKARSSTERVRNCTQIDRKIKEKIVNDIVKCLLCNESFILTDNGTKWNKGGLVALGQLPKFLQKDDLTHLKKECGGLQTLLKNHRYIFKIEDTYVSLREPYRLEETSQYKLKPCWYFRFHPEGCLYSDDICGYSHEK